jgi:hypothetical protein
MALEAKRVSLSFSFYTISKASNIFLKPFQSKYRFQSEIQQMMFVFGEVSDPLQESTLLVEDIVRSQVIEIVSIAALFASTTLADLIFT